MSSYFFRHCLVFSRTTIFKFLGSAGSLGVAVANAFIYSQWEREVKHVDICIAV